MKRVHLVSLMTIGLLLQKDVYLYVKPEQAGSHFQLKNTHCLQRGANPLSNQALSLNSTHLSEMGGALSSSDLALSDSVFHTYYKLLLSLFVFLPEGLPLCPRNS